MLPDLPNRTFKPFDPILTGFCESISKQLFAQPSTRQLPDLAALAFWLRKSHLEELHNAFLKGGQLRVPRGLVFHIAPANVEVMYVYSWILALLTGNANVVRLPSRESPATQVLQHVLQKSLKEYPEINQSTRLISYGHEEVITAKISAQADVRVLWGGDETIRTLRKIPLKVDAKEIVFPDRFAFSAINADKYLALSEAEQETLHSDFYNDLFWYDQSACSSPRALCWVGSEEAAKKASDILFPALKKIMEGKNYQLPLSLVLRRDNHLFNQALSMDISTVQRYSNELTVIHLHAFHEKIRDNPGLGLIYTFSLPRLEKIIDFVSRKDQTLTTFGFSPEELRALGVTLNGRGIDRIVPIGKALAFDYLWDGYNLLQELTRLTAL